jgi:hypothetical protein
MVFGGKRARQGTENPSRLDRACHGGATETPGMRPRSAYRNHSAHAERPASSQLGCRLDCRWQPNPVPGCLEDRERVTGQIRSCLTHAFRLLLFAPDQRTDQSQCRLTEAVSGSRRTRFFSDPSNHAEPVIPHQQPASEARVRFPDATPRDIAPVKGSRPAHDELPIAVTWRDEVASLVRRRSASDIAAMLSRRHHVIDLGHSCARRPWPKRQIIPVPWLK